MRKALPRSSGSDPSATRRPRPDSGPIFQVSRGTLALTLCALVLGVLFVAQFQTKPRSSVESDSRSDLAAATIQRLEQEQTDLKKSIKESRERLANLGRNATAGATHLAELNQELERQKVLAGVVPLQGRGVRVALDDSATTKIPADTDPSYYIVHEYQLRDVLNLLWQSGAEAVSLNGERVVATTSIYCVGSTILVNNTRLSPPYVLLAIGDPAALESAIGEPVNLKTLKARVKTYGIQLAVSRQARVVVPAFTGSFEIRHVLPPTKDPAGQPAAGG